MFKDRFAAFLTLIVVLTLVSPSAVAQSTDRTMPMRTPDGQPDISGIFTFRTLTPFERPSQFEGRQNLSAEEAAAFEASERARVNRDLLDPEDGRECLPTAVRGRPGVVQRVLVRAGHRADRRQTDVAGHRSTERETPTPNGASAASCP